jgi:hypothetical protein
MDFCRFGLQSFQRRAFIRDSASKKNNNNKTTIDVLRLQQSWVWGTTQVSSFIELSQSVTFLTETSEKISASSFSCMLLLIYWMRVCRIQEAWISNPAMIALFAWRDCCAICDCCPNSSCFLRVDSYLSALRLMLFSLGVAELRSSARILQGNWRIVTKSCYR